MAATSPTSRSSEYQTTLPIGVLSSERDPWARSGSVKLPRPNTATLSRILSVPSSSKPTTDLSDPRNVWTADSESRISFDTPSPPHSKS